MNIADIVAAITKDTNPFGESVMRQMIAEHAEEHGELLTFDRSGGTWVGKVADALAWEPVFEDGIQIGFRKRA